MLLYLQESSSTPPDSALTPRWSHMQTKEFQEHVCVLHVLNALPNILYKRRAIPNLIPFAMKKLGSWSLYTYLLKVKTIFEHHITHFSKYSFEGVILDIRHLPITVFFHGHISQTKNVEWTWRLQIICCLRSRNLEPMRRRRRGWKMDVDRWIW